MQLDEQNSELTHAQNSKLPYLSFVVVARNDDHGGNFLGRMKLFTIGLCEQLTKYNLHSELIIVDWNPPNDTQKLSQVVSSWFSKDVLKKSLCKIRIIEVPPEIHKKFRHSDKMALFQMIGKNVGIRRAKGEFVVATNIDLIFSNEIFEFLMTKPLKHDFFYRLDRYDVKGFPKGESNDDFLAHCIQNIVRINRRDGSFPTTNNIKIAFIKTKTPFEKINKSRSYYHIVLRSNRIYLKDDMRNKFWSMSELTKKIFQITGCHLMRLFFPLFPKLHTNACGDFTLLSKEKWHELRAYPEFESFSFNIDSLILQMAYEFGLKEIVLKDPMRMYHIEHFSGWTPESGEKLFDITKKKGIPLIDQKIFESMAIEMHQKKNPMISNPENWGLYSEILPEQILN